MWIKPLVRVPKEHLARKGGIHIRTIRISRISISRPVRGHQSCERKSTLERENGVELPAADEFVSQPPHAAEPKFPFADGQLVTEIGADAMPQVLAREAPVPFQVESIEHECCL